MTADNALSEISKKMKNEDLEGTLVPTATEVNYVEFMKPTSYGRMDDHLKQLMPYMNSLGITLNTTQEFSSALGICAREYMKRQRWPLNSRNFYQAVHHLMGVIDVKYQNDPAYFIVKDKVASLSKQKLTDLLIPE